MGLLNVVDFKEKISFKKAYELQKSIVEFINTKYKKQKIAFFILLEHTPVITLGRSFKSGNLLLDAKHLAEMGIDVVKTDRGGDAIYHGPGQITGYLIMNLSVFKLTLREFIYNLENLMMSVLRHFNIDCTRNENYPAGVWIPSKDNNLAKIGFIGIHISRWVTYHGFAFNVMPNLKHFCYINPCGIKNCKITSIHELLPNSTISIDYVKNLFKAYLIQNFPFFSVVKNVFT